MASKIGWDLDSVVYAILCQTGGLIANTVSNIPVIVTLCAGAGVLPAHERSH